MDQFIMMAVKITGGLAICGFLGAIAMYLWWCVYTTIRNTTTDIVWITRFALRHEQFQKWYSENIDDSPIERKNWRKAIHIPRWKSFLEWFVQK